MRVIGLTVVLVVNLIFAPLAGEAQQTGKVWRIGWLSPPSAETGASELDALRKGLKELNYIEGRNAACEPWNSRSTFFAPRAPPRRSLQSR